VALAVLRVGLVAALPFALLVRATVFFYRHSGLPTWVALAAAGALTFLVVTLYASWASRRLTGKARFMLCAKWVALPLVGTWCGYALLVLASVHAKSEPVRDYYTSVHPALRVALSTVILADPGLVITDMGRTPQDYGRMGLPVNDRTRHYRLADGWVHAVDLRTEGRSWIKNLLVRLYFEAMGFDTLRHVGTADHLHVELPPR
jgi:hypothetical protein